jgi:hypothetical protein
MATLYFNGAVDGNWNNLDNWWTNSGYSIQASGLPTSSDNVIAVANINSSSSTPTVSNFTMISSNLGISINVTGMATLDGSNNGYEDQETSITFYGVINGNATFNNGFNSLYGTVNEDVIFNSGVINEGFVDGNATFNQDSRNAGSITGDATFNDTSINDPTGQKIVGGNAFFYGYSHNLGYQIPTVSGYSTFYENSYNMGVLTDAAFNDSSYNDISGIIEEDATFNDSSTNSGTVTGNATFNNNSYNKKNIDGNITINRKILGIANSDILGIS